MTDATQLPFDLPALHRRKLTVDFAGGNQSSDGGLLLLRAAEKRIGIVDRLAAALRDRRDPTRILHTMPELLKTRIFAIDCGYADGNDLNDLRVDPALKIAVGRLPETGRNLCSQSTMSRLENAPTKTEAARLTGALADQFCASFDVPPLEIMLDIDDTPDIVHGGQQLSFWNAHHDERCFMPIHVYHVDSGKPVVMILRTGKTPGGIEVRTIIKHLTKRIRKHWPATKISYRGDGHYGRPEAMEWAENNSVGFIFGQPTNKALDRLCAETADALRFRHAMSSDEKMRSYTSFEYQAGSWSRPRRVIARLESAMREDKDGAHQEMDIRYIVTTMEGEAQHLYEDIYCKRGQAENLIKLHKSQLASDRTSCHSATANQVRLVLHTAAYWLMHTVREAIPKTSALSKAEFATIRERLLKIGARVVEFLARIRVHLPTSCPDQAVFAATAAALIAPAPS